MYKGDSAAPETRRRRGYHRNYYQRHKAAGNGRARVSCPTCSGLMMAGSENCWNCKYRLFRWDKCACGRDKTKMAKRCHHCAGAVTQARLGRLAAAKTANPHCPNKFEGAGECETHRPHIHCECGLPIAPDIRACAFCVAEQVRIEFKTWPKENAA